MGIVRKTIFFIGVCLSILNIGYAQTGSRIPISSITPSISTGQDYTPWLNDDVTSLVADVWGTLNMQYIDVKLKLSSPSNVTSLSLYDYTGTFTAQPAYIYAVNGTTRTLIATFIGPNYMFWENIPLAFPVLADTIVVRKYGNNIPQKIKIFGNPALLSTPITGWASVCAGGTTSLGNATWGGVWSSGSPAIATVNSSTGVVTGVSAGIATISYTVSGLLATKAVTVNAGASPGVISGAGTACVGGTTTLTSTVTSGTWSSSATGVATVSGAGVVTGMSAGTATISYTVSGGCGTASATKVVTINSLPVAGTVAGASTICRGSTAAMTVTGGASGGTWTSSLTSIATVSSTGVVTGVAAGTASIIYTVTNGCGVSTTNKTVTVTATPVSGTVTGASSLCTGTTTAMTISGITGGTWSSSSTGVATVNTSGVVTGVAAGAATISYTTVTSCGTASATKAVTVSATPVTGTITGASSVCPGTTTTMTIAGMSGGAWTSSSTGVATVNTSGVVTGVAAGTATISYTATTSCGTASATKTVTVSATPGAGSLTGTATVCSGSTTALTVSGGATGGTWSSTATGVATVNTSGVVTGVAAGTATISYTVTNSCGTTAATKVVTVNAATSAGTISGGSSVAMGTTITLTNSVSGGAWSSSSTGVASVSSSGVVTGVTAGTATISYVVAGSCGTATATRAVTVTGTGGMLSSGRIPIEAKRWYQLNNCSNGLEGLFDGVTSATVGTGWGKILANYDAYYPVLPGEVINIDSIKFYDGSGSNESIPFTLYYIDSLWNKVQIATFIGTQYNSWVGPNPSSPFAYNLAIPAHNVRYLVINCSGTYPNEMELYGSYSAPSSVAAGPEKNIKLKQQFGINAFEWDFEHPSSPLVIDEARMNAAKNFTAVRHYLDWEKLEPNSGGYTFNPSHSGGWNLDTMYARCKAEGIEVLADIKTIPGWMVSTYPTVDRDGENVPVTSGADFSNPASYIKQAKMGFQFAARYGNNPSVSSSLLSVDATTRWSGDPANVVRKGMNVVKYIECDNERDKWWKGRKAYQTGREYAANLSAFYDGNMNTMGPGVGVKNADTSMKVVMGGVAMPTIDFLIGMIDWCKEFRGYKADGSVNLCWDVINYHLYSDDNGSMQGTGTRGAAPEVAHADTFACKFIKAAHTYAKDMPVWITETGYDINTGSVIKAIPIGTKTALQTQADWILRTSLLNARMGIERTFFYMMYDDNIDNPTKFASSGFINPDRTRKPAADYLRQANRVMGEYVYKETISSNPIVDRYELDGVSAYVLVKPTENGSTMSYTLNLGVSGTARVYTPTVGQDTASVTTLPTTGTNVTLTVTETPIFVKAVPGGVLGGKVQGEQKTVETVIPQSKITVYPNPTTGSVHFTVDNDKANKVDITVYDEGGRACKNYSFDKSAGKFSETIDIGNLPNGLYFVEFGQGNDRETKKVIKVNR
jgi:endoglucanase